MCMVLAAHIRQTVSMSLFLKLSVHSPTTERLAEPDLPQAVLESLFSVPRSPKYDPSTMNWRNVVKKFELLAQKVDSCHSHTNDVQQIIPDKGDEYQIFRKPTSPHWDSVRTCYQRAAKAYSKGEHGYAAYLSEQGKLHTKKAREADEKASQQIFKARNKDMENVITIDLHGQHVGFSSADGVESASTVNLTPSLPELQPISVSHTESIGTMSMKFDNWES